MRRVTLMLAAMALLVGLFAAAAYAATITGTPQPETLLESNRGDTISAFRGNDRIDAGVWQNINDTDVAWGNRGADYIRVDDGDGLDTATGGPGNDVCFGDPDDVLRCETENQ
jgi:Ca2+-binding RTX toxin-like protein